MVEAPTMTEHPHVIEATFQTGLQLEPVKEKEVLYISDSRDFCLDLWGQPIATTYTFLFSLFSELNISDRLVVISPPGSRFAYIFRSFLRICFGMLKVF